ncbi:MAG: family 16 glycoside hydrolase [Cytophagales bacterium]|nr:family 16 glycoside hydrolase [Cytophagales bacterium]
MKIKLLLLLLFIACAEIVNAQTKTLTLQDLSDFKPQAGNWQIVGDVTINPDVDIHKEPKQEPLASKSKGKKTKVVDEPAHPQAVTFMTGKGILLNMNDDKKRDHLITSFEHGDIEIELEVMLPKGSNSGIYLQGRYEVQLLDSWGVKNPAFGDIGGIYRNWETEQGKIYMGKAPLSNPAKAPGLWQKFHIVFQAPRFDAGGKKLENAKFLFVDLNGVRIHENLEVPLPTGGPIENNEKPLGPLMIQGDHGPVAFRNIKYTLLKQVDVSLSDLTYQTWYGDFKVISDYAALKPNATGSIKELTCEILENENEYGTLYKATITVSDDATYKFSLAYTGGARLIINNKELTSFQSGDGWWRNDEASVELKAGSYPIEIYNYKDASWMPPRLALFVQTGSSLKPLHAYNSYPPDDQPVTPIFINPGGEVRLLRAFLDFKGDYKQRLTHTIGVGDPSGTNYIYDLKSGNLVCVWHGDFVDATPMWHERGDGSFRPRGATQYLFTNEPLAFLASPTAPFPMITREAEVKAGEYSPKGYEIETSTGRPIFKYAYEGIEVADMIYPDQNTIVHHVDIKNRGTKSGLYYKLAEGKLIQKMPNGAYAIDDKSYYIKANGFTPEVRELNGVQELVLPVQGSFSYSIIW